MLTQITKDKSSTPQLDRITDFERLLNAEEKQEFVSNLLSWIKGWLVSYEQILPMYLRISWDGGHDSYDGHRIDIEVDYVQLLEQTGVYDPVETRAHKATFEKQFWRSLERYVVDKLEHKLTDEALAQQPRYNQVLLWDMILEPVFVAAGCETFSCGQYSGTVDIRVNGIYVDSHVEVSEWSSMDTPTELFGHPVA